MEKGNGRARIEEGCNEQQDASIDLNGETVEREDIQIGCRSANATMDVRSYRINVDRITLE